jgi:hypothetical protein
MGVLSFLCSSYAFGSSTPIDAQIEAIGQWCSTTDSPIFDRFVNEWCFTFRIDGKYFDK